MHVQESWENLSPTLTPTLEILALKSSTALMVPELADIPRRYSGQNIDLMLVHLGGTTIPSPSLPLLMVTMDAEMGIQLMKLIDPDVTVPIHYEYVLDVRLILWTCMLRLNANASVYLSAADLA